jgi:hypothetical protein
MVNRDNLLAFLLVAAFAAALAGCAGALATQPVITPPVPATPPTTAPHTETPDIPEFESPMITPGGEEQIEPPGRSKGLGEVPAEILEEIMADLVQRTGADQQDIQVVRAQTVTWSDGALGCPQKGMVYIQVLINGYWVVLRVDGQEYDYRVSDPGNFTLCEGKGSPPISPPDLSPGK